MPNSFQDIALYSIPGCYPTAATLALAPVCESALLDPANSSRGDSHQRCFWGQGERRTYALHFVK